jgi:hypothetical protein
MARLSSRAAERSEAIMQKWLRRIGGAVGMGFTWAAAWGAAGMVPRWIFGFNTDVPFPLVFGVLGFIAGIMFSGLLMLFERRRALEQMTFARFASWGALSGFLLSAIFARLASVGAGDVFMIAPTFAIACAVCASGSLAMAKRAERRELPSSRQGSAPAQLTNRNAENPLRR